jgi:hypothetical protein
MSQMLPGWKLQASFSWLRLLSWLSDVERRAHAFSLSNELALTMRSEKRLCFPSF